MRTHVFVAMGVSIVCAVLGAGCSDNASSSSGAPAATTSGTEPQSFAEQVTAGQDLYARNCAHCHGSGGEGTDHGPRVVGLDKGALPLDPPATAKVRKTQFKTLADVAGFAVANMPADNPGSLQEWQYWSILAFDVKANGLTLPKKLDMELAKATAIH